MRHKVKKAQSRTIDPLEATAWRDIKVITIWTEQLDSIEARNVRASARDNARPHAIDTRANPKDPTIIFLELRAT